jgi:ribosomal 50S subunit-recycling heat shock protein
MIIKMRGNFLRLDKFLKVTRIIKRRVIANEACDSGKVLVNGRIAKAGLDVKLGDIIEVKFKNKPMKFEVISLSESIHKENAQTMYKLI